MPRFTVRVELHGAEGRIETYDKLHKEMEKKGFSRQLKLGEITYEMPPAEYNRNDNSLTADKALDDAKAAAAAVWNKFSVLVTQAQTDVNRKQFGLKVVKKG
jgi:hypothetical protein